MAIDQGVRVNKGSKSDAQSVIDLATKQGLKIVDLKFIDLIGSWQHFSIPVGELGKSLFENGIGFDGSSIRGFQHIHESDMLLIPDASTAMVDPAAVKEPLSICRTEFAKRTSASRPASCGGRSPKRIGPRPALTEPFRRFLASEARVASTFGQESSSGSF